MSFTKFVFTSFSFKAKKGKSFVWLDNPQSLAKCKIVIQREREKLGNRLSSNTWLKKVM